MEMDRAKLTLVNNIINFLKTELNGKTLSEEKKESLEVAVQCLETTYGDLENKNLEKIDLLNLINVPGNVDVTDEQKAQAEQHKAAGNDNMKALKFQEAIEEYSKAIRLNPYNAVYYCNRAAGFTKLYKDLDAISDCKEAIKLEPTYGKAHGRLGIAYSNLNKFDLAVKSYETALRYDPANAMYETNLDIARKRSKENSESIPDMNRQIPQMPAGIAEFMNNPNIINMANQVLNDGSFHSMMQNFLSSTRGNNPDGSTASIEAMLQAGQALAQTVAEADPNILNRFARPGQEANQENPDAPDSTEKKN